ncbi:SbcC/MukB-like Walker B domain-containing protein [Bdellovibrio reynosensis]|uniref:AAA family ATPase n=1 Tax=Bdellovibrio reynosensis TaxID=2835041 RepID=A0ABY4CGU2_9BACT|nr:SbcC/MukB-like Walker B domain-containing protein [Bdellovibrio reynosensis]UOF02896.1 hypothetical protein MNR06_08010 [Bdellovibrio reynosensis]
MSQAKQTGYEISKIELWNFGTYNSYQKIPLSNIQPGSLADLRSHVMFTGKNGSGKSTLMDLIWIALLPDERLLRLGVVETASPEGKKSVKGVRSTTDYILGKYLSGDQSESVARKTASPYLRHEGTSAILLTLTHRETGKSVSIGRFWWYSNHILKNENAFFICRENFSINGGKYNLMNPKGTPYESARLFLRGMKSEYDSLVEVTSKGNEYTRQLGEFFGGIESDDIVLLMKAANAKAIDNVNYFVRDFILSPLKDQAIESLMDRIKETSFLAKKIQDTTAMYELSKQIVEDFDKIEEGFEKQHAGKVKSKLLEIYSLHLENESRINQKQVKEIEIQQCQLVLDQVRPKIKALNDEEMSLAARVNSSDTAMKMREVDSQISLKEQQLDRQNNALRDAKIVAKKVEIEIPTGKDAREKLIAAANSRLATISNVLRDKEESKVKTVIEISRDQDLLNTASDELNYLERNSTSFPKDLYEIKLGMMRDLGIQEKDIMFVGELFMIPSENRNYEKAIKAVFSSIASRLVVHPQYEVEADAWLNRYKNKRRIGIQSLKDFSLSKHVVAAPAQDSVLDKIKFRDPSESSFYYAVREWLQSDFDVRIVEISEFSKRTNMVVTKEGYVKINAKYRVKHGERIDAPIGWDPEQKRSELLAEVKRLRLEIAKSQKSLETITAVIETETHNRMLLMKLLESGLEFLDIPETELSLKALNEQKEDLSKGDDDYNKAKKLWSACRVRRDEALSLESAQSTLIKTYNKEIEALDGAVAESTRILLKVLDEKVSRGQSLNDLFSKDDIDAELTSIKNEVVKSGITFQQFAREFNSEVQNSNSNGVAPNLYKNLNRYKTSYPNPSLEFDVNLNSETLFKKKASGWKEHLTYLGDTELPTCHDEWNRVYSTKLWESIRDFIDTHKKSIEKIKEDIETLNSGIRDMKFEKAYLELGYDDAKDDQRIKEFNRLLDVLEGIFSARFRSLDPKSQADEIDRVLEPFSKFMADGTKRDFATDPRNHFVFYIKSTFRSASGADEATEIFRGSSKDAKSGGQTVQLCYVLLAMALAQKFHFNDPIRGLNTFRFIILDEFADKLDNEKPEGIVKLFGDMGFQAVLLTPYSKVDLLRPMMNKIVSVIKNTDTQHSKAAEIDIDNLSAEERAALIDPSEEEYA